MTVRWGTVHHTADRIAIIGTGPSLSNVTLKVPDGVRVIAVNSATRLLTDAPDFWFTLDPSQTNRKIMAQPKNGTAFYAAVPTNYGTPDIWPFHLQAPPEPDVTFLRRYEGRGPKRSKPGLSTDPHGVHVGNSGYGALNLAFLMRPKRIALLGIDGHGKYARPLSGRPKGEGVYQLRKMFPTAVDQLKGAGIEVVVGSTTSKVKCWPQLPPQEALDWLVT